MKVSVCETCDEVIIDCHETECTHGGWLHLLNYSHFCIVKVFGLVTATPRIRRTRELPEVIDASP